jgi:hypothetical protein
MHNSWAAVELDGYLNNVHVATYTRPVVMCRPFRTRLCTSANALQEVSSGAVNSPGQVAICTWDSIFS